MTRVFPVPAVLDESAIDVLASEVGTAPVGKRAVIDARQVRSADPPGATGLLLLGHALAPATGRRPLLQLPRNRDVRSVMDTVSGRTGSVLPQTLGYGDSDVAAFGSMLRELLHNVGEQTRGPGWACIQAYRRLRRINRPAVVVAVAGVGASFGEPLETALSGEHALAWVHEHVRCWGGRISIRSGTSRLVSGARREEEPTLEVSLAPLPGAQISVLLPARRMPSAVADIRSGAGE